MLFEAYITVQGVYDVFSLGLAAQYLFPEKVQPEACVVIQTMRNKCDFILYLAF